MGRDDLQVCRGANSVSTRTRTGNRSQEEWWRGVSSKEVARVRRPGKGSHAEASAASLTSGCLASCSGGHAQKIRRPSPRRRVRAARICRGGWEPRTGPDLGLSRSSMIQLAAPPPHGGNASRGTAAAEHPGASLPTAILPCLSSCSNISAGGAPGRQPRVSAGRE